MTLNATLKRNEAPPVKEAPKAPAFANPAAVGLGAFGATTMLLQFFNLGLIGTGVVMWMAFFFGGAAQIVAGLQESRTGNNFGYAAFTTYGAFWLALGGIFLSLQLGLFHITDKDIGYFLIVFTLLTLIYLFGAMKQNSAVSVVFLTLLIGYILLDVGFLGGGSAWIKVAGGELLVCSLSAWYLMAHVALSPLGLNIPAGKPWLK